MKICIVGAGAIGGMLAVKLAALGAEVSVIVRGANLQAVRANGMKLIEQDGNQQVARVAATDRIADLGAQDIVILSMKAHQLAALAGELKALRGAQTVFVTMQNGIPWWYFHKHGGPYEGRRLESVDPDGAIAANIEVARVIGCVVYPACEIVAPGVIRHIEGNRFSLGELDGAQTDRIKVLSELLRRGGLKSPVATDIRAEIWLKLWGNSTFNPISALTHATLVDLCQYAPTRDLATNMMREAQAIAAKLSIKFPVSLEKRIAGAEAVGPHKTSMLQDIEAGRPIELDALVGSVIELGRMTETPTPHLDAVYACAALLAKTLGEERGKLRIEPRA
jgi:2-dehydropantoate 2-reductase